MKREELEQLGLSKEAIDKIMSINGKDIENASTLQEVISNLQTGKQGVLTSYEGDDKTSEMIEALIYPSDGLYASLGLTRSVTNLQPEILEAIKKDVSKVNKNFQSYSQITKISILKEPLEMTTTQKVKRNFTPKTY